MSTPITPAPGDLTERHPSELSQSVAKVATSAGLPTQFAHPSAMTRKLEADPHYYWFLVIYVVMISAMGSFVNDMYTPSLPSMTRFFHCSVPVAQMGLTTGMIGLAVGQIFLGPLSDRYGRKPVLVGSVAVFIIAAVVSIFSPTIHMFNTCRFFQGVGASGGYFLARTIPADIYSGRNLAKLMALIGAINGLAPASAPVIGGVVSEHFSWKGVFVLLSGFAVLVLLLAPKMKETLAPAYRDKGPLWKSFGGYKILLKNKAFMIHVGFKGMALGLLFAYVSAAPFILQTDYGFSQTMYGVVIGVNAIFVVTGSLLALKFRPMKRAAWIGSLILLAGCVGEAVVLCTVHNFWLLEIFFIVVIFALGLIFSTTNTLAMNEGRMQAGEASSVLGVSGYVVGAIVSPLVGMGDVLHSTSITMVILAALTMVFSFMSRRLPADLTSAGK